MTASFHVAMHLSKPMRMVTFFLWSDDSVAQKIRFSGEGHRAIAAHRALVKMLGHPRQDDSLSSKLTDRHDGLEQTL
jgi:hypothetical protein